MSVIPLPVDYWLGRISICGQAWPGGGLGDEARAGSSYCVVLGFIPFLVKSDSLQ